MPDLDQMVIVKVTADVSEFRSQMKSAGSELDQFGAKAKTVDATSGSLANTTKSGTSAWQSYAQALQQSYGLTDPLTRGQTSMIRSLEQQVAATKLSGSELSAYTALRKAGTTADTAAGQVIAALAQQHYALGAGTRVAAGELHEAGAITKGFRETVHGLHPVLATAGLELAGLGSFASAARGGVIALGGALTGSLIFGLAKAGDEAERLKQRMQGLAPGNVGAGLTHDIEASATKLKVQASDLSASYESIFKAQEKLSQVSGVRSVKGLEEFAPGGVTNFKTVKQDVDALFETIRMGGANSADATKATNEFFAAAQRGGGVTAQIIEKLRDESPAAARELANLFNRPTVSAWLSDLEQSPVPLQRLLAQLNLIAPAKDEAFKKWIDPTTGGAIDDLINSTKNLWKALGESSEAKNIVQPALEGMVAGFDALANKIKAIESLWGVVKSNFEQGINSWLPALSGGKLDAATIENLLPTKASAGQAIEGLTSSIDVLGASAVKTQTSTSGLAQNEAQLAAATNTAAGQIAADANQIAGARNTAAGAAAASGDGISAPDMSGANVGDNAQGGIYSIGSGGGTFPLRGTVHSGEIVAIIPSGQADKPLLDQLQSAIGSSPISIGAGGGHIDTSTSSIAAPASYASANQSAALSAALAGQSPSAGVALSTDQVQSAIASVAALQAQNQAAQGAVDAATPESVPFAAPAAPAAAASAGAPVGATMADAVKKAQALQNPQTAFTPSVGGGYAFVGGRVVPISGVSIPGSGADGGGSSGRGKGGGDLNFGGMSSKSDVGDVSIYSSSNLPGAASLSRVAAARAAGVRGGAEGPVSTSGQMAKRIDMAGSSIAGATGYRTLSDTQRALNLGSYGFVGPTLDQALQGYFQGPTLGMLDAGPSLFQLGLSGLMDASAYGTPDLSSFYDAFGGTFTQDYSGGTDTTGVDYGSFYDATGSGGDPYAATSFDAGDYATGGMFKVPGSGGKDSVRVNMRMSPGETGMVLPPGNGGPGQWMGGPSWWQNPQPAMPSDSAPVARSIAPDAGAGDVNIAGHVIINTQGALGSPMSRAAIRRNMRSLRG